MFHKGGILAPACRTKLYILCIGVSLARAIMRFASVDVREYLRSLEGYQAPACNKMLYILGLGTIAEVILWFTSVDISIAQGILEFIGVKSITNI